MAEGAALLIIDMQREMERRIAAGRDCVNPEAPDRILRLAAAFRHAGRPVVHVRHASDQAGAALHPESPFYPPMACAEAEAGEAVFVKAGSSGFVGTGLEAHLRARGIGALVVVGAVAGFCVNTTVRGGADLGFAMTVVRDAVIGFDLPEAGLSARVIFDVTMAHLAADFADLADAAEVMARLPVLA
ncbi:isochorismatase family protein [Paragemmobacter ruber]|uniref:Isochorismatase family protein n=1 Tax=Paragemmobacter ruber TaxID=1985673 RepID=A0ABW9Y2E1_9RHOB|nr:isochorismatase family protein [Rhodobacter ruber]NBE06669.1 isochorismatase family protein [Rhodobacter ruber]